MDYNLPVSLYRIIFFRGSKILMLPEIIPKHNLTMGTRFVDPPFFIIFFNSSLLWDIFIINSVEQLQTLPKTQSEIDISPFLKTQKPSIAKTSGTYVSSKDKINKYLKSSKIKSYQYIPYS